MQILTPSGYKDIADCAVGDEVCAFDMTTGAPIINTIETLQWVDAEEWARWWQIEPTAPPFQFFRINGTWTLNSEQSIWRNDGNVCHAKHLVVGDVIYDDADHDVTITSIEEVTADGWWRLDISGDHSYIVDGLTLHNASRFWVLGTGSVTPSNTANWAAASNGAGGQSVPGVADATTWDANSGGGTATLNFGGAWTVQSVSIGSYTSGTWDNSVNNNNVICNNTNGFSGSGFNARTIKLGSATYFLTAIGAIWDFSFLTTATVTSSSASIDFTGSSGLRFFHGGGLTYNSINVTGAATSGNSYMRFQDGSTTVGTLNIGSPNSVYFSTNLTVTGTFTCAGSASSPIGLQNFAQGSTAVTISLPNGSTMSYTAIRDLSFSGASLTATNSFNLGNVNPAAMITGPSGGGGGSFSAAVF